MPKYASGKFALGISDRSGFAYPLKRMKREWTGALVGFDEYEAKQPQLNPTPKVFDPQALRNPRPDRPEALTIYAGQPNVETPETIQIRAIGSIGFVTVTIA